MDLFLNSARPVVSSFQQGGDIRILSRLVKTTTFHNLTNISKKFTFSYNHVFEKHRNYSAVLIYEPHLILTQFVLNLFCTVWPKKASMKIHMSHGLASDVITLTDKPASI